MLGLIGQRQPAAATPAPKDALIFDIGLAEFEDQVLVPSMETPILVDFWAPWCGPCKQLMPVLEAAVTAAAGAVRMAKVNIDEHPQLAQAFRVQSVPTVLALFQGQPVTGFMGVQPPAQIKALIDQLLTLAKKAAPEAINIPETLKQAAQALTDGDLVQAQENYAAILEVDPNHLEAYSGLIRVVIAGGAIEEAQHLVDTAPDIIAKSPLFAPARTALELAKAAPVGDDAALLARVQAAPDDHAAKLELATLLFAQGRKAEAIDQLIASIAQDRMWNEEAARKQLLQFFDALGPADPDTVAGRKALSRVLFA
ncbi:MAG: thioredoxin [Pseudomonadota bacterium]